MDPAALQDNIQKTRGLLKQAHSVVAFSGAGISTPSGIPDFRSAGSGMWERFDPMEVASLTVFRFNPKKFWDWKRPLLRQIWAAQPNPAHLALAEMESAGKLKAVITQNIDGLHQRAGSKTVLEVHGSVETMSCPACRSRYPSLDFRAVIEETEDMPRCPSCGEILKPDIVLYEEMLPQGVWYAAEKACAGADVMLVVGSSLEVYPAAALPEMALEAGARLVIVNLSPTHLDSRADVLLPMDVARALPLLAVM
jgi:NAD-dependent deacetylase